MTMYQKIRTYLAGKRKYRAVRHNSDSTLSVRQFYASSIEQAQAKFIKWTIYPLRFSMCYNRKSIRRFYWRVAWLNCMSHEYYWEPKIYRWGYWNFTINKEEN